jgi:surface polysaccharide O-acyltransferase-like enzyme
MKSMPPASIPDSAFSSAATSDPARPCSEPNDATVAVRDQSLDAIRGVAILMVVGIHALHQPLPGWAILIDAVLRPAVPVFLFLTGYLTAATGRVPLARRFRAALIPYAIAFVAAYGYMMAHNAGMDHRPAVLVARFGLGYVFVYYYVFVYLACTLGLWLIYRWADVGAPEGAGRLVLAFTVSIVGGLVAGNYLDPLLSHLHVSETLIEEARLRDIPFWFSFVALGALIQICNVAELLRQQRLLLWGLAALAYLVYASARLFEIGDAASYDSAAFFAYAALFCCALIATPSTSGRLATIGAASYFIYLWHIFPIMALRDGAAFAGYGVAAQSLATFVVALGTCLMALALVRSCGTPRFTRWIGA